VGLLNVVSIMFAEGRRPIWELQLPFRTLKSILPCLTHIFFHHCYLRSVYVCHDVTDIGSDSSAIVVACHAKETKFQIGDYVVSRFDEPQPVGGLAEYRMVKTCLTEKCPSSISPVKACGLPASSQAAKILVRDYVKLGDRVLVIGGSGAVGTSVLQYAKLSGASEVVAVSTQADLCKSLGATRVIDYRTQKWWEMEEYHKNKFDVVIDLVNGDNWIKGGCAGTAIDPKGTYVALLSGVETELEVHGMLDMVWLSFEWFVGRMLWSRLHPSVPKWVAPNGLKLQEGDLDALFQDVVEGKLKPILDPSSPFSFTETDVRKAFHLQKSRHAHGKVVIQVAEK
jgi:NADPH:quinone reductase-like Zn-dependent oxidoreductase